MGQLKRALITGITGQLGSWLAEHLLALGNYSIHGLVRPTSDLTASRERIDCFTSHPLVHLYYGDLCDQARLTRLLCEIRPHEIYNLAAQSHVKISFDLPLATGDVTGLGVARLLEAVRDACPQARVYQASSSELFGDQPAPQHELTPFRPRSPYAAAKLYAYSMCVNYREAYGLHVSNGILFNSESPRRGPGFVTRKITRGVARIYHGRDKVIKLGNLDARRDWMHARDAVRAMHLMLQQEKPDDYVLATGRSETVMNFLGMAASHIGRNVYCINDTEGQKTAASWTIGGPWPKSVDIEIDKSQIRPTEVPHLCGDATKARERLGWKPEITLEQLVKEMVEVDLKREAGRA